MKRLVPVAIIILFLIPAALLFYKYKVLHLSLLPQMIDDVWNVHISVKPKGEATSVSFPVPRAGDGLKITDERIRAKGIDILIDRNSDSSVITWLSKEPIGKRVSYSARIDIRHVVVKKILKDNTQVYPKQIKKYLKKPELLPEEQGAIELLEKAILEGNEDKTGLARKIYYYVEEEIQRDPKQRSLMTALETGKGSPLVKARLFTILARRQDIPTRIVAMVRLPGPKDQPEEKYILTYANEVFLNNHWIPVDTNRGHFGERPDRYLVIHHHYEEVEKIVSRKNLSYRIDAERAVMNKFNKAEFKKEIMGKDSFLAAISFYRLPLPVQSIFSTIILVPLGALILCLARNIVGLPTFGMFTPILLTLFFKETSLSFGLFFFLAVVALGIVERYVLDKFYLLAMPRLSVILTLVILLLMVVSLTGLDQILGSSHIGYFPIVIVTTFIERFSIMLTEEGPLNTFKTLAGTLIISILSYMLYSVHTLEVLVFTNPELLLAVMGCLILIGKYKGYRLSEFLRFRDLVKQVKTRSLNK